MANKHETSDLEISQNGKLASKNEASIKLVARKISRINNEIVDIIETDDAEFSELKSLKEEIRTKCEKLFARQKELKKNRKARVEIRLLKLGERRAYQKEFLELGGNPQHKSLTQIPAQIADKILIEA